MLLRTAYNTKALIECRSRSRTVRLGNDSTASDFDTGVEYLSHYFFGIAESDDEEPLQRVIAKDMGHDHGLGEIRRTAFSTPYLPRKTGTWIPSLSIIPWL